MTSPTLTRNQGLALALFVIAAFVVVAWRTQVNATHFQNSLEHNRAQSDYQSCIGGQAILTQFDNLVDTLAKIEFKGTKPNSPTYDKIATPTRLERVAAYKAAHIIIPVCVKPKP